MNLGDHLEIGKRLLFLLRSQWWPEGKIRAYQEQKLVSMMRHASANVPFYRDAGIRPESIRSIEDLRRFPVIAKKDIQDRSKDLIWPEARREPLHVSRTSGSTCEPTETFFDREAWLVSKHALKIRRVVAVINPLGKKLLMVHPSTYEVIGREERERPKGFRFLTRQMHLSLFEDPDKHISAILDFKPDIINGYPSYFMELAARFREKGMPPPRIATMFTSSEFLSENARRTVQEAFRGRVFDVYGSTEFKEIAWQCREGTYHINFEHVFLETQPSGSEESSEESLVITSLTNRAMPLLRFAIGDLGAMAWGKCACGRRSPRLTGIRGRMAEMMSLPSGRRISPYVLTTTVEEFPQIRKYQIVQASPNDMRIDVVAYHPPIREETLASLRKRLMEIMKEEVRITFNQVSGISRSKSGKYQIVRKSDPS